MPVNGGISKEITAATYQNFDGSNTTLGLYSLSGNVGNNTNISVGAGASTNFSGNTSVVFEGKGKYSFNNNTSVQLRIRSSHSDNTNTTQFRISPGVKKNIGENTSVYLNPYASAKINYNTGKWTTDYGAFGGVSQNLGKNVCLSAEIQKYKDDWGVNGILCWKF